MQSYVKTEEEIASYVKILGQFLHRRHRVLILFPEHEPGSFGWMLAQAVQRCGCVSVSADRDFRWKNILRLAFSARTETIIGTPDMILGLHKAAKATDTPLFVHDVLLCGTVEPWQEEGIRVGLDCRIWQIHSSHMCPQARDDVHLKLEEHLLSWSSILDFRVSRTESGVVLEVVAFPGEKMPELPSCAKLILRQWNPETDAPFLLKKTENS